MIDEVVGFSEQLTPVALIGAGGIGKTSIILTVLHDDRIKQRFGDNRWFIRCDQFPPSHAYLLRRLSKVIGAGTKNPKDLTSLRQYLSSREMLIVLDNAESILDPQGANAQEIYSVVDELTRFSNICLCITSRISTIPPGCETLEIPTLSIEAASDTFYRIYKHHGRSDLINDILEALDFHPLSITLLATVAQQNKWDANRMTREWKRQRTGVLRAQHSGSLAATVEISLASSMFQELGPDARELLGVIAFFPHGVDEKNIEWLFPTISDGPAVFDSFCILSLTYRGNGFIMMLAPLRDYLCLRDPQSSPLLVTTKECYFARLLAVDVHPDKPFFEESRWIMSEDVNVEHLLDTFMSIDASLENVWKASEAFMDHIIWHKPRFVMLGPKIEALPDDHPSKAQCIRNLSWSFHSIGNWVEHKRLLNHSLKLWKVWGNDREVAETLCYLSEANRLMNLYKDGIQDGKNASEIFERLGDKSRQAECLICLAYVLRDDKQLDAAEKTASRAIDLLPEKGQRFLACDGHRALGNIHQSKGDTKKAIHHFRVALEIGSPLNYHTVLFWIHYSLAELFFEQGRFDDAHAHVERAKSHAANNQYQHLLGRALLLRARFLDQRHSLEEAKSEALHALEVFESLGAADDAEETREFLEEIDLELFTPAESTSNGKLLEKNSTCLVLTSVRTRSQNGGGGRVDTCLESFSSTSRQYLPRPSTPSPVAFINTVTHPHTSPLLSPQQRCPLLHPPHPTTHHSISVNPLLSLFDLHAMLSPRLSCYLPFYICISRRCSVTIHVLIW